MIGSISRRSFVNGAFAATLTALASASVSRGAALPQFARIVDEAVTARAAPGYSAFVGRGSSGWAYAAGVQDLATGTPMATGTLFRVASITKPVVAAAAMALVDDGKIALHDPVDRWIPELSNRRVVRSITGPIEDCVPAARRITLHDLLTLQMGLGALFAAPRTSPLLQRFTDLGVAPGPASFAGTSEDFLHRIASLPLAYQPGERWLYHTGMDVAGILVARVSGRRLSAFIEERITGPLGMEDTSFFVPAAKRSRLATTYARQPDGRFQVSDAGFGDKPGTMPAMESGGSGLISTATDFGRFGRMLLRNGLHAGKSILSERSVQFMRSDQIPPAVKAASPFFPGFWDTFGWGLGAAVSTRADGISRSGRFGWWGGTGTTFFIDPATDTAAVLLSQRMMSGPDDTAVSNAFLKAAFTGGTAQ